MIGRPRKTGAGQDPTPLSRKTTEVLLEQATGSATLPSATPEPALIMVQGGPPGQVFRLQPGRQLIGRRPECEIRVRERAVSGIHAEVLLQRGSVTVIDLQSTNGTMVNGVPVKRPVILTDGSLLRLGNCVFKYVESSLDVEFLESLHSRGITDQLTGTLNQSFLVTRLAFALDLVTPQHPLAVVAFDFDDFKQVNDRHGHAAGDHVLRASCALIREIAVGPDDLFARMGGEEFVLVLPNTKPDAAFEVAERIRVALAEYVFEYEGHLIRLTSSFGIASSTSPTDRPETVLAAADELLYRSKRDGRNKVTR